MRSPRESAMRRLFGRLEQSPFILAQGPGEGPVLVHQRWDLVVQTAGRHQTLADLDCLPPRTEQEWALDLQLLEHDPGRWHVQARRTQLAEEPLTSLFGMDRSAPADEDGCAGVRLRIRRLSEPWRPRDVDTLEDLLERELRACSNVQIDGLTALDVVYYEVMPSAAKAGALVRQAVSLHSVHLDFDPANMRSVEPDEWE
jgi:hypothetical protein